MSTDTAPATPKGEATKRRILDAASGEFASHGIAGARVDRIARAARTNKAQLYAYFGSKEGLFDAVFADRLQLILDTAPIDADDLADWAVRLYDDYLERPDVVRLAAWHRLERQPRGPLVDGTRWEASKVEAIAAAQAAGRVRRCDPFDLMALVIGMSCAWSPTSGVWASYDEEAEGVHQARRDLVREAVRAVVAPQGVVP
jgi:AcrR family transcriptional regulator